MLNQSKHTLHHSKLCELQYDEVYADVTPYMPALTQTYNRYATNYRSSVRLHEILWELIRFAFDMTSCIKRYLPISRAEAWTRGISFTWLSAVVHYHDFLPSARGTLVGYPALSLLSKSNMYIQSMLLLKLYVISVLITLPLYCSHKRNAYNVVILFSALI